jgi:hypothetical protein
LPWCNGRLKLFSFVKVNLDAAFVQTYGSGAWNFIIGSHQSAFLIAYAGKIDHFCSTIPSRAGSIFHGALGRYDEKAPQINMYVDIV